MEEMKTLTIGETTYEIVDAKAREEISKLSGGNADGLSDTAKALLITILRNGVYSTDQSANITALENALASGGSGDSGGGDSGETETTLTSISAVYSGGDVAVGTALADLTGIVVTAHYSDGTSATVTGYSLSGTIAEGGNTITVSYGGKTTTFAVTGISEAVNGAVQLTWSEGQINNAGVQTDGSHSNIFDVSDAMKVIVTSTDDRWTSCALRVFDSLDSDVGGTSLQLAGNVNYIDANPDTNHPESVTFDVSSKNYVCVTLSNMTAGTAGDRITVVKE